MVTAQSNAIDKLENYLKNFIDDKNFIELKAARQEQETKNGQRQNRQRV